MGETILILGGARSGKSNYAVKLAKKSSGKVAFIATCLPLDKEMEKRIRLHKEKRPSSWHTFEEPENLSNLLKRVDLKFSVIIIDCLTLLVSNLLLKGLDSRSIEKRIDKIIKIIKMRKHKTIIISNEVGLGIVPKNDLARKFRDLAGKINQMVVQKSDKVFFMVSGMPLIVKGEKNE